MEILNDVFSRLPMDFVFQQDKHDGPSEHLHTHRKENVENGGTKEQGVMG